MKRTFGTDSPAPLDGRRLLPRPEPRSRADRLARRWQVYRVISASFVALGPRRRRNLVRVWGESRTVQPTVPTRSGKLHRPRQPGWSAASQFVHWRRHVRRGQ